MAFFLNHYLIGFSSFNFQLTTQVFIHGSKNEQETRNEEWLWKFVDVDEATFQLLFPIPMMLTNMSYYGITLISVRFAGHLGDTELARATLGNSWCTDTGLALMFGILGI